jgi:hypothetical protein
LSFCSCAFLLLLLVLLQLLLLLLSLLQVAQLAGYFEPLIVASVGVASRLRDHQQQMTFLDQTKTLAESTLQMLYAAKEGGGNPKVTTAARTGMFFFIVIFISY